MNQRSITASAAALAIGSLLGCGGMHSRAAASSSSPGSASGESGSEGIVIRLIPTPDSRGGHFFEVSGLDLPATTDIDKSVGTHWGTIFPVYVAHSNLDENLNVPAIIGDYSFDGAALRFAPRFPVEKGVRYRALFYPNRLRALHESRDSKTDEEPERLAPVSSEFVIPAPPPVRSAFVAGVYPTADLLPENQLKFYIHFSAPMSRGRGYRHIHLYDKTGAEVDLPFLEIDEELWDPQCTRLTLFFDPGRIKRGVRPREELGPALRVGHEYTLTIDSHWEDAEGNQLVRDFRKSFRVGEPDYESPDPHNWQLDLPAPGTREPVEVRFGEPLDHALANRLIWVVDSSGQAVPGIVAFADQERQWNFAPDMTWTRGRYALVVGTVLEDLAGNSVARPFEVDTFPPVERKIRKETVSRSFEIPALGIR